jgi:isocitrate dehydrogenase (NAD+)
VNVSLRKEFELFANIRPAIDIVPGGRYDDIDIVMVRENVEGLYIGVEHYIQVGDDPHAVAESAAIVTRVGCERIIRYAFEYALKHGRKRVTAVHKANILKTTGGLFLESAEKISKEYAGRIAYNDLIVDNCAMQLVLKPEQFDVIVTTNMFGDILSDEVSGLVGGLGLAPGANIGSHASIFEAVHGSAPDIAGKGVANPAAQMLAAAMMLDHVGELKPAQRIREAIEHAIVTDNVRTRDLGGSASTRDFGDAVVRRLA